MGRETTACWYWNSKEWLSGKFHSWGSECCEDGTYTIAIVEDEKNGRIDTLPPQWVRFTSDPGGKP